MISNGIYWNKNSLVQTIISWMASCLKVWSDTAAYMVPNRVQSSSESCINLLPNSLTSPFPHFTLSSANTNILTGLYKFLHLHMFILLSALLNALTYTVHQVSAYISLSGQFYHFLLVPQFDNWLISHPSIHHAARHGASPQWTGGWKNTPWWVS